MRYGDSLGVTGTPTLFVQYGDSAPVRTPPQPSVEQLGALIALPGGGS
jgi:protein-disulfide isomerase